MRGIIDEPQSNTMPALSVRLRGRIIDLWPTPGEMSAKRFVTSGLITEAIDLGLGRSPTLGDFFIGEVADAAVCRLQLDAGTGADDVQIRLCACTDFAGPLCGYLLLIARALRCLVGSVGRCLQSGQGLAGIAGCGLYAASP